MLPDVLALSYHQLSFLISIELSFFYKKRLNMSFVRSYDTSTRDFICHLQQDDHVTNSQMIIGSTL